MLGKGTAKDVVGFILIYITQSKMERFIYFKTAFWGDQEPTMSFTAELI